MLIVRGSGIEALDDAPHVGEIAGTVARVMAGKLGRRGHPQPIAEPRDRYAVALVDRREVRRPRARADARGERIALDRVDRQLDADAAREPRTPRPQRKHVGVRADETVVGRDRRHALALDRDAGNGDAGADPSAALHDPAGEAAGELGGVSGFVAAP